MGRWVTSGRLARAIRNNDPVEMTAAHKELGDAAYHGHVATMEYITEPSIEPNVTLQQFRERRPHPRHRLFRDSEHGALGQKEHHVAKEANHSGAMCALYPTSTDIASGADEPAGDMHVTMAFLGEASDLADGDSDRIQRVAAGVAASTPTITGEISGPGHFDKAGAHVALVDSPHLSRHRENLVQGLKAAGIPVAEDHGFTPHITTKYGAGKAPSVKAGKKLKFTHLSVVLGGKRTDHELTGVAKAYDEALHPRGPHGKWARSYLKLHRDNLFLPAFKNMTKQPNTYSGHKLHVYADNISQVADTLDRIEPVARRYGLAVKAATERYFDVVGGWNPNKGVTIYLPHRAEALTAARAVRHVMRGYSGASGIVPGDEMLGNGVGHRFELNHDPGRDVSVDTYDRLYQRAHAGGVKVPLVKDAAMTSADLDGEHAPTTITQAGAAKKRCKQCGLPMPCPRHGEDHPLPPSGSKSIVKAWMEALHLRGYHGRWVQEVNSGDVMNIARGRISLRHLHTNDLLDLHESLKRTRHPQVRLAQGRVKRAIARRIRATSGV